MKHKMILTRRKALVAGLSAMGALVLPGCTKTLPPTYGNILRMGDALTYVAHRALLPGQSLVKEYAHGDISSFPAIGTVNPGDSSKQHYSEDYAKLTRNSFEDWRLVVEGSVKRPAAFSLAELQSYPVQNQITRHTCEEGWTAIAEWSGVPLGLILQKVGITQSARFVSFYCYDGWVDSIDMLDAFHPQTILAYGMNGRSLPIQHGAPLRLRVETQVGYKSLKYLSKIVVTDEFVDLGDSGWAWYVGI